MRKITIGFLVVIWAFLVFAPMAKAEEVKVIEPVVLQTEILYEGFVNMGDLESAALYAPKVSFEQLLEERTSNKVVIEHDKFFGIDIQVTDSQPMIGFKFKKVF